MHSVCSAAEFGLLNDYQQCFPLCREPFATIGREQQLMPDQVLCSYRKWQAAGVISRIGPVFAPNRIGVSTLAALAVPPAQLESVATRVSSLGEVNHNYEREHHWNLWFVVTAADATQLARILAKLEKETACRLLRLPLKTPYHIDLGFDLGGRDKTFTRPGSDHAASHRPCSMGESDLQIVSLLQPGLPLVEKPYRLLAAAAGIGEARLLARLDEWRASGLLKRFGVVVRHHELGYRANAMCVWELPENDIDALGRQLALQASVTLCYRLEPHLPDWPYNLYCMIHGQARDAVRDQRDVIATRLGLDRYVHQILFSGRRFKQCGARYATAGPLADEFCHA